jgi:hypothetical protein
MSNPRITAVEPLPEYHLLVTFDNGAKRVYDCTPHLDRNSFRLLRAPAFFRCVAVDPGGYGISWSDEADLAESELWTNGVAPAGELASQMAGTHV